MQTYVYVDGFNLYYRAVKGTRYKWLDLKEVARKILPRNYVISKVKYFTAIVSASPRDPQKPHRQRTFIRALQKHIPDIEIYEGIFRRHPTWMPLEKSNAEQLRVYRQDISACVVKTEEKGSDVNLAVHLVNDAWHDRYDCGVVISNDSDLAEAIRLVRSDCRKEVWVISPDSFITHPLRAAASQSRYIRKETLAMSQLPDPIPGTAIHKPPKW